MRQDEREQDYLPSRFRFFRSSSSRFFILLEKWQIWIFNIWHWEICHFCYWLVVVCKTLYLRFFAWKGKIFIKLRKVSLTSLKYNLIYHFPWSRLGIPIFICTSLAFICNCSKNVFEKLAWALTWAYVLFFQEDKCRESLLCLFTP